ncbi:MAG: 3-hydroxyacyl-CoA dehydrogenase family protein [Pseudomonadota bacterium]
MSANGPTSPSAMRCAVLGAGTMGAQIALSLALGGCQVILWARRATSLDAARGRIQDALDFLVAQDLVDAKNCEGITARVRLQANLLRAVADADFLIEAVAEDLAVKRELLARAQALAPAHAIVSSTTSALSASALASDLAAPERFCIAHYAQPAHLVALVEVVPGRETTPATTQAVTALLTRTGKSPVLCPDIPGFLWARIQHVVLRELVALVEAGLVTPQDCDTILKKGYASRLPAMGAFEHADLAGLDLITSEGAKAVWEDLSNARDPAQTLLGRMVEKGHTGMNAGQGFYDWRARDANAFKAARDAEIVRRAKIDAGAKTTFTDPPPDKT